MQHSYKVSKKLIVGAAVVTMAAAMAVAAPSTAFAATADPRLTAEDITNGASGTWHDSDDTVVNWSFDNGNLVLSGDDAWVFELSFENNITQVKSITWKIDYSQVRGSVSDSQYYIASRFPNLETFKVESSKATSFTSYCFNGCKKLSKVDLSEATGITTLSSAGIFLGCESLKALDLSKTSITTIEQGPFSGSCLESITLPENLTTLGTNALADCGQEQGKGTYGDAEKGIKSIVVPSSVTTIGQNAFSNLLGLKVVYLPAGITNFNNSQNTQSKNKNNSEPTFSKEYVVYNNQTTTDPTWVTTLWNGTDDKGTGAWKKNTAMHKETFSYPLGVVNQIEAAAAVTSFEDMTNEIITGLLSARAACPLSDLAKAAPGLTNVNWTDLYAKSDAAWKILYESVTSDSSASTSDQKAALVALVSFYQDELKDTQSELDQANENVDRYTKLYLAAQQTAFERGETLGHAEYQLKQAQAQVEELQKQVETDKTELANTVKALQDELAVSKASNATTQAALDEAQTALNEAQAALNNAQASVVKAQDQNACLKAKGATKSVKLGKAKKTKKAASVQLKLAASESGAAAVVAKASGNKNVTVSSTGKVTLKKGVKKGTYKAKITVTYGASSKTVTVKFKVK